MCLRIVCVKGKLTWASGDVFDGFFRNGVIHGLGLLLSNNGTKYKGGWRNNQVRILYLPALRMSHAGF